LNPFTSTSANSSALPGVFTFAHLMKKQMHRQSCAKPQKILIEAIESRNTPEESKELARKLVIKPAR
jgi:hypothetical protein